MMCCACSLTSSSSSSTSQNIFTDFPLVQNQRPHDAPQLQHDSSSSRYPPSLSSRHLNGTSEVVHDRDSNEGGVPDSIPPLNRLDSIGLDRLDSIGLNRLDSIGLNSLDSIGLNRLDSTGLDRLDSIGLLRLPSINLEELQHVSGTALMMSPRGWGESSLPLSTRGDSFDVAASSVAGVPLQQQTSFDQYNSLFFDPQMVKSEPKPVDQEEHRPSNTAVSFAPGIAYCEDHQAGRPLSRQLPFSSCSVGDKRSSGAGAQQERSAKQSKLNEQSECCLSCTRLADLLTD